MAVLTVAVLTVAEEVVWTALARSGRIDHRDRVQARIVLAGRPRSRPMCDPGRAV